MSRVRHCTWAVVLAASNLAFPFPARSAWLLDGNPICVQPNKQSFLQAASDWNGGAFLTWSDGRFGNQAPDIYAQRIGSDGTALWAVDGIPIHATTGYDQFPNVIPDGAYGAILVWDETNGSPGGNHSAVAQRVSSQGTKLWPGNGTILSDSGFQTIAAGPIVAMLDGSPWITVPTGSYFVWLELRAGIALCFKHLGHDGEVLASATLAQGSPWPEYISMTSDGVGSFLNPKGVVVVWCYKNGSDRRVLANRVNPAGVPQWGSTGISIAGLAGSQTSSKSQNVGGDKVVVVWDTYVAGAGDIYAQKLDSAGNLLWTANGLTICSATGTQFDPQILAAGSGGSFLFWTDYRTTPGFVYGQRLDSNGSPLWTPNGIPICTVAGVVGPPSIASDEAGGTIVSWQDNRNGDGGDVYAQRVDASGNLLWNPQGVLLCDAVNAQSTAILVPNGTNGAIAAWVDARSDAGNIYATSVVGSGGTVEASLLTEASGGLRFAVASSNPTRSGARFNLQLQHADNVTLDVLDVAGRRVRAIVAGDALGAGAHELFWDGAGPGGTRAAPGTYFVRLTTGTASETKRIVVVK